MLTSFGRALSPYARLDIIDRKTTADPRGNHSFLDPVRLRADVWVAIVTQGLRPFS
jgi:hypothetical protein